MTSVQKVDTIVLAGGVNHIAMFPGDRPGRKALLSMRGKPLIAYVLDALRQSEAVGRIIVVGHPDVLSYAGRWPGVDGVKEGYSLIRNAQRGLRAATTDRVLFCNPDQPLLTTPIIDSFLRPALEDDADIVSSWVNWEKIGPFAVEGDHKFEKFGDGRFAHGNLFLVRRDLPEAPGVRKRLEGMYAGRKNSIQFAWAMGPGLFVRFLWARVNGHLPTLQGTLDIAGQHFGVRISPVICDCPEIVLDIDEPEDYSTAEKRLEFLESRARLDVPMTEAPATEAPDRVLVSAA